VTRVKKNTTIQVENVVQPLLHLTVVSVDRAAVFNISHALLIFCYCFHRILHVALYQAQMVIIHVLWLVTALIVVGVDQVNCCGPAVWGGGDDENVLSLEACFAGGCHSHRLYSHGCNHTSELTSYFWHLTVDHTKFWGFDHWPHCISSIDYAHIYGSIWKNVQRLHPFLVHVVKLCRHGCDYWVYGIQSDPLFCGTIVDPSNMHTLGPLNVSWLGKCPRFRGVRPLKGFHCIEFIECVIANVVRVDCNLSKSAF